jgi:hypothetical protein
LFTSPDVPVVSCAAVDPVVVDVLNSADVPGVASGPDVVTANTADDVHSAIRVPIISAVNGIPALDGILLLSAILLLLLSLV